MPDSVRLNTVVIQSTRVDIRTPVPHTNLSAEQIASTLHAQDIPFLLAATPSLVENSDAGTGIGYTGMRIRGSDPTRINVTLNGIPLNDAESQGLFWVNLPDLAASAAEIQVQRGVGSSTNGAGAFGATVNVDLSRVQAAPFATLSSTVGSFQTWKQSAYVGTGLINNRWAFTGRLSGVQSAGFIDRAAVDLFSYHLTGTYISDKQSLQAHVLSGKEITYQAWNGVPAQYLADPILRRFNTAGAEKPDAPYRDEVDNYTQRHYMLMYKRVLSAGLELQLNAHYTRGYGYFEQYKAQEAAADYGLYSWMSGDSLGRATDLVRRRWLDNHFYGATYALHWTPQPHQSWMLGGGFHQYQGRHFGEIIWAKQADVNNDYVYYDNDARKQDGNVFLKVEHHFSRGLSTFIDLQTRVVGYRFLGYNNFLDQVDQEVRLLFFNPKLGLNYRLHEALNVYLFAGMAHREPNRDDYTQSSPSSRPRVERLLDLEGGLKWKKERVSAQANLFYMQYYNQLVLDGRINDVGAFIRTNVRDSYRAGLELEAQWRASARWTLDGHVALSRNKVREFREYRDNWDTGGQDEFVYKNTDLAFSPAVVSRLELTHALLKPSGRHQLALSVSGKYVGVQYLDNTGNAATQLSPYFYSDIRANYGYRLKSGQELQLVFSVLNVLNAQYSSNGWAYRYTSAGYDARGDDPYVRSEGAGVYHQAGFFPQAGRHVMCTMRWLF